MSDDNDSGIDGFHTPSTLHLYMNYAVVAPFIHNPNNRVEQEWHLGNYKDKYD